MDNEQAERIANELCEAFEQCGNAFEKCADAMHNFGLVALESMVTQCAEKFLHCAQKWSNATWATRWYWKRKMNKYSDALDELILLLQKYNDDDNNDKVQRIKGW